MYISLLQLWITIQAEYKKNILWLLSLMVLVSVSEVVSIGAFFPFLLALTKADFYNNNTSVIQWMIRFGIFRADHLVLSASIFFASMVLLSNSLRLLLLKRSTSLAFSISMDLSAKMYQTILYSSYPKHIERHSSQVIDAIVHKSTGVAYLILSITNLLSSSIMLAMVLTLLCLIDLNITLVMVGFFGFSYLIIGAYSRRKLLENGNIVAVESSRIIKILQESWGGFRDILMDQSQKFFLAKFYLHNKISFNSQSQNIFLSAAPRFLMEGLGILVLIIASSYLLTTMGPALALPVIGLIALTAQRMLPVLQQLYQSWSGLNSGLGSLLEVLSLISIGSNQTRLSEKIHSMESGRFKAKEFISLKFDHISFRYPNKLDWALRDVSFEVVAGERVGIVGATGCGKSTMLDLAMGLISPQVGNIYLNNFVVDSDSRLAELQSLIAHVPQSIFLRDSTIQDNISYGRSENSDVLERVKRCAQIAELHDFIESLPLGYQTLIGESGVFLSGGQRQRLGIARALFKDFKVLILDEATSALDVETENKVLLNLSAALPDVAIIMVTHRYAMLESCNKIIRFHEGVIQSDINLDENQLMTGFKK